MPSWETINSTNEPDWGTLAPTQTPSWTNLAPNTTSDWGALDVGAVFLVTGTGAYIVTELDSFLISEEINPDWGGLNQNTSPNWTNTTT